jgi:hypothetical protein
LSNEEGDLDFGSAANPASTLGRVNRLQNAGGRVSKLVE